VKEGIYDAFMKAAENAIELFHGYTYFAHPVACAAALAALDIYEEERLFEQADKLADYWENAVHSLKGVRHVIDVRNLGLVAGIELESIAKKPGKRAFECFLQCYEKGLLIRTTGDIIAWSPPLIIEKEHIDRIVEICGNFDRGFAGDGVGLKSDVAPLSLNRQDACSTFTGKMPVPHSQARCLFHIHSKFLVGWAGEPAHKRAMDNGARYQSK
jgi:Adenosylmethionine-8-amino-7-oxononanoate aminotransferase